MNDTPQYRQQEKPLHEYLRQHAREQAGKPAYIWYGAEISYAQLDSMSDACTALLQRHGVARGDRVALFMNNCPQYAIAHFGIQKAGAIVAPCSPLFREHELQYQLSDLGAKVIIAADVLQPVIAAVLDRTDVETVLLTGYGDMLPAAPTMNVPAELTHSVARPEGALDFLAALQEAGQPAPLPADMDDVALMTYTSGTTGMPKGAMLTLRNALFKASASADCNGIARDDMLLAVAPMYHIAGMLMGINALVYAGASAVLLHRFEPVTVLQAIDRYRVTMWYSVAPMNVAVMQAPDARSYDLSSLRMNPATSFGITLTEALARQWRGFAPNCHTAEAAYGLSETHTCDTYMPRDAVRWGTQGVLAPGVACRIVDPDTGAVLPPGALGEIALKSPGNFRGYWNKPEATAATLREGWVHTGDMGKLDADGYLTFTGRFKEMIKVSGYSVFPEEVETILIRHPAVAQAAVIGIPDPAKGEVVKAFIVRKPGVPVSEAEIAAWSREQMSPYKAPREVAFIDALPATGTGKVLRRLLR